MISNILTNLYGRNKENFKNAINNKKELVKKEISTKFKV
jgi:hypothetical protein